jgi:2-furoyl-CoA dehydrogenase large subunit
MAPALRESVTWSAPELTPTTARDEINTSLAYGFGFDFCGIEIDRDTGEVRVDKYVTAHDCGTILNPGLADGQIHGSFAAALGASLYEEFSYAPDGTFLSGTFADYLVATAAEMPKLDVFHPVQSPSPFTRLGAKGIAEGNQYSTPVCLANAVADAIGRSDISVPLNPSKVLGWLSSEEQASRSQPKKAPEGQGAISGSGHVSIFKSPQAVWSALLAEETLKAAVPGCEELARTAENKFHATVTLGVGPVKGRFEADIELADLHEPHDALLRGRLSGPLGAAHGSGNLKLTAEGEGCRIDYAYNIHLSGRAAMIGGRMIRAATRRLVEEFFQRFARAIEGESGRKRSWLQRLFGGHS